MIWIVFACIRAPQPEVSEDLAEVSEQVIFASVEDLGSHIFNSTVVIEEFRDEAKTSSHAYSVEIIWSDWDHFSYRRLVDGNETLNVRVVDGKPYKKSHSGLWVKKRDAEPYRIQMSHAWNVWEQNTKYYQSRMIKRQFKQDAIESRNAQIYNLSLRDATDLDLGVYKPLSLAGSVWIDKKTAVRLKADVQGVLQTSRGKKTLDLKIERSKIGHELTLKTPTILPKEKE